MVFRENDGVSAMDMDEIAIITRKIAIITFFIRIN